MEKCGWFMLYHNNENFPLNWTEKSVLFVHDYPASWVFLIFLGRERDCSQGMHEWSVVALTLAFDQ